MPGDRTGGSRHKLKHGRGTEHWDRLPRAAVLEAPALEIAKPHLGAVLRDVLWVLWPG